MNTIARAPFLTSKFWIIAFVILLCVLYVILVYSQSASKQTNDQVPMKPAVVEQTPPEPVANVEPRKKTAATYHLRKAAQFEKYKPNEL